MSGTLKLSCGHFIVVIDPLDDVPEEGPWCMLDFEDIAEGDMMTCLVQNRAATVTDTFTRIIPLNRLGVPK